MTDLHSHIPSIENQFFITSTMIETTKIENQIGDALVNRIIRAYREGTPWRAIIVIPLVPGFPMPIDHPDASSVRIIVECQYRSICRGENSIFGRLRKEGIAPEDYISFFSLRSWAKLRGGVLTTEQVYIHGKIMVVDDRLALIGSANINERSQRGDRDSELACVVRDTDMIDSTMAGKPYKVGRFPHTLRVRLMQEHLGIDVDNLHETDSSDGESEAGSQDDSEDSDVSQRVLDEGVGEWDPDEEQTHVDDEDHHAQTIIGNRTTMDQYSRTVGQALENANPSKVASAAMESMKKKFGGGGGPDAKDDGPNMEMTDEDDERRKAMPDHDERLDRVAQGKPLPGNSVPTVEEQSMAANAQDQRDDQQQMKRSASRATSVASKKSKDGRLSHKASKASLKSNMASIHPGGEASSVRRMVSRKFDANPWSSPGDAIDLEPDMFEDPIGDDFYVNKWIAVATRNTQIYRKVFKCVPDDMVTTWSEYKAFLAWGDRLARSQVPDEGNGKAELDEHADKMDQKFPIHPGAGQDAGKKSDEKSEAADQKLEEGAPPLPPSTARTGPLSSKEGSTAAKVKEDLSSRMHKSSTRESLSKGGEGAEEKQPSSDQPQPHQQHQQKEHQHQQHQQQQQQSKEPGFSADELRQMEELLEETQGHLVVFSTRWLEKEGVSGNLLYPSDALLPLNIYT